MHQNPSDEAIRELLTSARTIAVVGASNNPDKPAHAIPAQMQRAGYKILPVNPRETSVLGEKAYTSFEAPAKPIAIVLACWILTAVKRPSSLTPGSAAEWGTTRSQTVVPSASMTAPEMTSLMPSPALPSVLSLSRTSVILPVGSTMSPKGLRASARTDM